MEERSQPTGVLWRQQIAKKNTENNRSRGIIDNNSTRRPNPHDIIIGSRLDHEENSILKRYAGTRHDDTCTIIELKVMVDSRRTEQECIRTK